MSKIAILGAGSWGIGLSVALAGNGHDIIVWSVIESEIEMLNTHHEHLDKLPGVKLPENIKFTTSVEDAIQGADILVLAVPSPFTRSTSKMIAPYIKNGQIVVNVAKGIEEQSLMTLSEVIEDEIPTANVAVLSGPSHAEEVGRGLPTTLVAGAKDQKTAQYIQNVFMSPVLRVYVSPDILGIELGGALKNVVALAAGIADGLGFGDNTKAALITRGISEISRLGVAMGGKAETFGGLTGIGDLVVTCASMHSRNRRAGILIGQGKTMQEAMDEVHMVVEGVYSAKAAAALAKKYNIEVPIIDCVNNILFNNMSAKEAGLQLMDRDRKLEYANITWS